LFILVYEQKPTVKIMHMKF